MWKFTSIVLFLTILGYLVISALRPDISQNWRDDWHSFFAPRDSGITQVQIHPAEIEPKTDLDLSPTPRPTVETTHNEPTAIATTTTTPQTVSTFAITTLPVSTATAQPLPTFVLPTLSPVLKPERPVLIPALPTLPPSPTPSQESPTPPVAATLATIPTLQPIPTPTPTPTPVPPSPTPTPDPTATPVPSPTLTPVPPTSTVSPIKKHASTIDILQIEALTHDLINAQRSMHGIHPLDHIEKVRLIARSHSEDMASRNYFSHDNLEGLDPSDRGRRAGYDCRKDYGSYYTFGLAENIHQGWLFGSYLTSRGRTVPTDWFSLEELARNAVNGWMNSPGHRQNILDSSYDRAGMGIAISDDGKVFFTQNFC